MRFGLHVTLILVTRTALQLRAAISVSSMSATSDPGGTNLLIYSAANEPLTLGST
jgi:hypothetical protein